MSKVRVILLGGAARELRQAASLAQESGAQVRLADSAGEALAFARHHGADLMLVELGCNVPALIASLRAERIAVPVLACGIDPPASLAVAAVRAGAIDFLPLPPSRALIAAALLAIGERRVDLIGEEPAWRALVARAERLSQSRSPLLLTGGPGSGRRTLARFLHARVAAGRPLVEFDAAAVDPDMQQSELFGHRAGSFAGAIGDRVGKLVEAQGGTLLLAHVDRLPRSLQQALAHEARTAGTRLVATAGSRADLHPELAALLTVGTIELPPLARRGSDLARLARHVAVRAAEAEDRPCPALAPAALAALEAHDWPGNVAELEEIVGRAVLLASGGTITPADLVQDDGRQLGTRELAVTELVGRSMEEVERALIIGTLARCGGNRTSASALLGISVRTMRNKLRALRDDGVTIAPAA